jgi:drug/metabolite transporter (DMT)-like permease
MTNKGPAKPARRSLAVGLVLLAALGFSFHTTLSRASYDHGPDPATILFLRSLVTVVAIWVLLRAHGVDPWLKGRALVQGLVLGLILSGQAFAMLSALYFMPASLVILIFYLYPLIVAGYTHVAGLHRVTAITLASLLAALAGVTLALGVSPDSIDWRGVVLALAATITVAVNIVGSAAVIRKADSLAVTFVMSVAMLAVFGVYNLARGKLSLPSDPAGWWPLAGCLIAYLFAAVCFYSAIGRLGPQRVAMAMNVEPVLTISLAALILEERLTPVQFVGAALVIAAIFASRYAELRRARQSEP